MTEINVYHLIIPFLVAFLTTLWIHPKILKIAIIKNLVDNPDARKLQRRPTPVMGGIAVFFGIILGLSCSQIISSNNIFIYAASMMIMLYIGTIDDILNLSPKLRFIVEIGLVAVLMAVTGHSVNNFFGLWGLGEISIWFSAPLTIVAAVGIINAINLIDGVNGLSTGFCIMASTLFAIMFTMSGNATMAIIAVTSAGAIIPFFLHNVFGKETRMFIGDGGALVMGIIMSIFIINMLCSESMSAHFAAKGMGLIPFCLAVLSIPVFDTLRVMTMRIIHGTSPFNADKTHLHHLFIDLGFSHIGTTFAILCLNILIVLVWWCSYLLGASIDVQLYIVLLMGILITFVFYKFARKQIDNETSIYRFLKNIGDHTHIERKSIWRNIEKTMDKL